MSYSQSLNYPEYFIVINSKVFFLFPRVGLDLTYLARRPRIYLLYHPRMIDEYRASGGIIFYKGNLSTRRKPALKQPKLTNCNKNEHWTQWCTFKTNFQLSSPLYLASSREERDTAVRDSTCLWNVSIKVRIQKYFHSCKIFSFRMQKVAMFTDTFYTLFWIVNVQCNIPIHHTFKFS
jgi:hypothetical protein